MNGTAIGSTVLRVAVGSALVAGAAYIVWRPLDSVLGRSLPAQAVSLGLALAVAAGVYYTACRALRVRELQALSALRGRLRT